MEFYVWQVSGAWENIFHFTLGGNTGDGHRHPALWTLNEGGRVKLHVTASVSGNPGKTIFPVVDKDAWHFLEYGCV